MALPSSWTRISELAFGVLLDFMNGLFVYAIVFIPLFGAVAKKANVFGGGAHAEGTTAPRKTYDERIGQLFGLAIAILVAREWPIRELIGGWVLPLFIGAWVGLLTWSFIDKYVEEHFRV